MAFSEILQRSTILEAMGYTSRTTIDYKIVSGGKSRIKHKKYDFNR